MVNYSLQDQVLWLDGDEFTKNPVKILNQIEAFIGIPQYFNENHFDFSGLKGYPCFKLDTTSLSECMGKSKARPHPELSKKSLNKLRKYFDSIRSRTLTDTGIKMNECIYKSKQKCIQKETKRERIKGMSHFFSSQK